EPDLNRRPSGYEPDELPSCSIPRPDVIVKHNESYQFGATHEVPDLQGLGVTSTLARIALCQNALHVSLSKWSDTRGSNS
ncbi:hypothetical protein ACQKQC_27390, partial [Vibrio fortis]|uniref:hypothetical protein n=1 Tax=Vibrio fortis TaxID=212667 RepID=UPI00406780DD